MSRIDRLLNLLQILRSYRYPVSGQNLAARLNISIRTLYRDIATLQAQGAEIDGAPGVGYVLQSGFFIPPLMFSQTEIESLMLGIRWVSTFGDQSLSSAAESALSKIREVLPAPVRDGMGAVPLRVGPLASGRMQAEDLSSLRDAIRRERKVRIVYVSKGGQRSHRTLWPFAIGYFDKGRILVGWCETRKDFRHFRTEGITEVVVSDERYSGRRGSLFRAWQSLQLKGQETL